MQQTGHRYSHHTPSAECIYKHTGISLRFLLTEPVTSSQCGIFLTSDLKTFRVKPTTLMRMQENFEFSNVLRKGKKKRKESKFYMKTVCSLGYAISSVHLCH